jgi:hypothetical protein
MKGKVKNYLGENPQVCRKSIILDVICGLEYLHSRYLWCCSYFRMTSPSDQSPVIVHADLKAVRGYKSNCVYHFEAPLPGQCTR